MKILIQSLRALLALTLLTGVAYPLLVWGVGQAAFREQAEGSLVYRDDRLVGSILLAQRTADARYFRPRPSAADYATVASGASNQAWTSAKLTAEMTERLAATGGSDLPADLLTASGSGLDPDLSVAAIQVQIERVATARKISPAQRRDLDELIARETEGGQLGPARVNVLQLNLALDTTFPRLEH